MPQLLEPLTARSSFQRLATFEFRARMLAQQELVPCWLSLILLTASLHSCQCFNTSICKDIVRPDLFLFIAIPSSNPDRREAIRQTWKAKSWSSAHAMQHWKTSTGGSIQQTFFFLSDEELSDGDIKGEAEAHKDLRFVSMESSPEQYGVVHMVFHAMEYAVRHYTLRFFIKADDDSYINLPAWLQKLPSLCEDKSHCLKEHLAGGTEVTGWKSMHDDENSRFNDPDFFAATGLATYPKYHGGAGYVISGDIVEAMVAANSLSGLRFGLHHEDASVGLWMAGLNVRHFNNSDLRILAQNHWFWDGDLDALTQDDACGFDPFLILHPLKDPKQMFQAHRLASNCSELHLHNATTSLPL